MKRISHLVLLALMVVSTITTAEAKSKKSKHKPKEVAATEATAPGPVRAGDFGREKKQSDPGDGTVPKPGPIPFAAPVELQLKRAGSRKFDLRSLPHVQQAEQERAELPEPPFHPATIQSNGIQPTPELPSVPVPLAPAPPPIAVYEGLDRFTWGAGSPPDTNGDAGPNNYIQTVNTSIGVYRKSDGFQQAAFTFNTFMSQGNFGNLCDTNNFGDPVVLYDTFEDRWIITDFAFVQDPVTSNVLAPAYQCFAASMTGDPVSGGWNFYSIQIPDALNDYPKLGIWPDGLYMSANMFTFGAGSAFVSARAWAFNKAQMYAGSPTVKVVTFNIPGGDFAVMPSNARLQTGTPPPGRPNLFVSSWQFTNALTVYKFHVDWNSISQSTFTGPDTPFAATSWPNAAVANAAQPGTANLIDVLQIRAMVQNQYTNFGGTESLWLPHTVRRGNTSGFAAPRWYQVNVTGGTVAGALPQATTWDPDGANVINRFMPSLALDRAGNMAIGYSTSSGTVFPSIMYAGRLAADPVNTFSQTEQTFFTGTASQLSSTRWGDYSAMTLDPDGCRFWYTSEYATGLDTVPVPPATTSPGFNQRWKTKFGAIPAFPGCVPVGAGGTVSGTVTVNPGGAPISGATVQLGSGRSTTTDGSGNYSFTGIPAGMYPTMMASKPAFVPASASSIVVTDGGTTTQNFSLTAAPASACLTDTTQADFLTGVFTNTDANFSPGDLTLATPSVDQQNTAGTTTGTGFGTPAWTGQTFIAGVTAQLVKADVQLFCSGCGATPPNLTLSVRNTAAGLPTGADLATATIPGSAYGTTATVTFTATFGTPVALTSGTQYALILRPVSVPAGSGYFWVRSSPSTYANGSRVLSADSGSTWSSDTTRDYNFKTYMQTYPTSGNFVSSPRDSNPSGGLTPIWSTFSWNASTPANTSLQFQLGGSNNSNGPFTFVGPDGTAGTFFTTSPVQLSPQFYNFRFLEYKAFLATTDTTTTPVVSDATACFNDVDCSSTLATITPTPAAVCASSTGNTASGPAGMTSYAWGITSGTITSATNIQTITYTAGASGSVTLNLTITAPNGCIVSGSTPVTINPVPPAPTITPGGPTTFCAGGSVTLTSDSASGNQWYLNGNPIGGAINQTYVVTASGNYTAAVTTLGCAGPASNTVTVTVNPLPATPTATPGGPTTFCAGGSVTLTSNAASGNQWFLNGNPIGGATNTTYSATASGSYTVTTTDGNSCTSAASAAVVVTVNPLPPTPTITPGGPTTFCAGGSVTLTSSSASGNQWFLNGNPIGGATNTTYAATASGNYTVVVTTSGCSSAPSAATVVTVNPIPATPTITPGGPTTFCTGGSVTLTSSSASGNQWFLNGNPIGGATNSTYSATASGSYTVTVTTSGCTSSPSAATVVTVNPNPNATITAPASVVKNSTGNIASVANAGVGATYAWGITNGTITAGTGTNSITFTAGASPGTLTLNVTVTTSAGCSDTKSANVTIVLPTVTVTSVSPAFGTVTGGNSVTINGTNFASGASVTFGGTAATSVVVVSAIKITAKTPAHAAGAVNVTVTNTDTSTGTLTNGFQYNPQVFDPNGDGTITSADIFFLVNYLFMNGPAPNGPGGVLSGDANGDGVVSSADIFYLVNYLFLGGQKPNIPSALPSNPRGTAVGAEGSQLAGSITLGKAVLRDGHYIVPVIMTANAGSMTPQSMSFRAHFETDGAMSDIAVRSAGAAKDAGVPLFEISPRMENDLSYLVSYDPRNGGLNLGASHSAVVAEIEVASSDANITISIDPAVTMLSDQSGSMTATVANGKLKVSGTTIRSDASPRPRTPRSEVN